VLANKQDLPNALSVEEVTKCLKIFPERKMGWKKFEEECGLEQHINEEGLIRYIYDYLPGIADDNIAEYMQRDIYVQGTCALLRQGLYEGLEWLSQAVIRFENLRSMPLKKTS